MYLHLLKYYAEVLRWERLDVDTTRRLQVAKFRRIFDHACAHSKFYRELYGDAGVLGLSIRSMEDIERIPVIDKQSIRSLPAEDILTVPLTSGDLCTHKTSGSTGEPMTLYASKREYHTSNVRAFRSLRRCGYTPLRSLATVFRGEPGSSVSVEREFGLLSFLQSRLGLFRRTSISSFEPVEQIIDVLQSTRTDLLWSTPSAMLIVARQLRDRGLALDIPVMVVQSETLFPEQRVLLQERVARKVVNTYGLNESPSVALDSPEEGKMDVYAESTLVEFAPAPSTGDPRTGQLVISNLVNRTMPILRYATGDLCQSIDDPGFPHRVIGPVIGRTDDILELSDGTELSQNSAYHLFVDFDLARQWKLVGTREGIELHIHLEPECRSREAEVIRLAKERWAKPFPNEPLRVVFTDEFGIDPRTGKSKLLEDRTRE